MTPIVQVTNLYKQYEPPKGMVAVNNICFEIQPGEIFSLLGPNGAGKTTTFSILSCLLPPTRGDVLIDGISIKNMPVRLRQILGIVPQEIALYPRITARQNLEFWGSMYGLRNIELKQRIDTMLEITGLTDRANELVETFSGGMKRRLNMAAGMVHYPKILFLDEPTVGVDPQSRRKLLDTVKEQSQRGMTVFYTTHYMEEAEEISHQIGIMDNGQLIALGTLEELTRLVGECDIVNLEAYGEEQNLMDVAVKLRTLPKVKQVVVGKGQITIHVPDSSALLPQIISYVSQEKLVTQRLEVQKPNLETVFLHLTGKTLRD